MRDVKESRNYSFLPLAKGRLLESDVKIVLEKSALNVKFLPTVRRTLGNKENLASGVENQK
tara:strand:- start:3236 stop:3418 length:183 start_codon:yes stop_codon:yes gene_type:complete